MHHTEQTTFTVWLYALALWLICAVLLAMEVILSLAAPSHEWHWLGDVGLATSAGAATLSIRGYICRLSSRLERREMNAYELGREVGREERGVRSIH